mgnify:CR=1 FL=1|jgi:hypothetical protein
MRPWKAKIDGDAGVSEHTKLTGGEAVQYEVGDRITLKKGHPCGANDWTVYRVGADIGLRCGGCGHRVMLRRRQVDARVRSRVPSPGSPIER